MNTISQTAALAVVDRYLVALNSRDGPLICDALNFPHIRIGAMGQMTRYEHAFDFDFEQFFRKVIEDGWSYTRWDHREVIFTTEGKAHVAVHFSRFRNDDTLLGQYFSLYIVTCQAGHWGIQVGSGNGT